MTSRTDVTVDPDLGVGDQGGSREGILPATLLVVLLLVIPSKLHVGALGSAGTPAQILAILLCLTWILGRCFPRGSVLPRLQPLHFALFGFVAAILASYVAATTRPIRGIELSGADRGLLGALAWIGMFVVMSDQLTTRKALDTVLWRFTCIGGFVALLGVAQFITGKTFVDRISIPGLTASTELALEGRGSGLVRVVGTATHALELGVVLTTVLPLAIHYAIHARQRSLVRRTWPLVATMAAIPFSISRSAILLSVVVLVMVLPTLTRGLQVRAIMMLGALGAVMYVAVPGLAGTFRSLFVGVSEDSSTQSRTGGYGWAFGFVEDRPFFGRGRGTYLPDYRILDNQYLDILIEMGVVGLVATLTLLVLAIATGFGIRRTSPDDELRSLGVALSAAVAAGAVSLTFYDGLAFPMATGSMFVCIGALCSLRRVVADEVAVSAPPSVTTPAR